MILTTTVVPTVKWRPRRQSVTWQALLPETVELTSPASILMTEGGRGGGGRGGGRVGGAEGGMEGGRGGEREGRKEGAE